MLRSVLVFDASDLNAESTFWAKVLNGRVIAEDNWHSLIDESGEWRMGFQLAPNHVKPEWPQGSQQQQIHLDLHAEDFATAHEEVMALGATLLQPSQDLTAAEGFQVYADPAGHPFCICWGQPTAKQLSDFLTIHFASN